VTSSKKGQPEVPGYAPEFNSQVTAKSILGQGDSLFVAEYIYGKNLYRKKRHLKSCHKGEKAH
jgi:hypothetical protein